MITIITGIGLFILSFVCDRIDNIFYNKHLNNYNRTYATMSDIFETLVPIFRIISIIITSFSLMGIIISHSPSEKFEIQKMQEQHDAYIELLEKNKDITLQNQLYKDIVEYNYKLRKKKHYSESLWTNWFYADGWDKLECIEIK